MADNKRKSRNNGWTLGIVSVALFMAVLDNLVVSVALPTIHRDLGASIQSLEWTVNAYVLAYAVLLLDRRGARRPLRAQADVRDRPRDLHRGLGAAALAPNTDLLVAARAVQGAGAAIVTPLTLTLLAAAFPAERRGMAIGVWSGISGTAVAIGPLVGGAVVQGISWHWIFWINVPLGLVLIPLAATPADGEPRPLRHARPARPGLRAAGRVRARVRARARAVAGLDERRRSWSR